MFTLILFYVTSGFVWAQCFTPDSDIWKNNWESCTTSSNPIASYGKTHWVLYDLGSQRHLSQTWVWNANDPDRLSSGFRQVYVDYSDDQINWTHWGSMVFPRGTGQSIYSGFAGPDLSQVKARYILFTVKSTYGSSCAGIAEFKFNLLTNSGYEEILSGNPPMSGALADVVVSDGGLDMYPNPVNGYFTIKGDLRKYRLTILDRDSNVYEQLVTSTESIQIQLTQLPPGLFFVKIENLINGQLNLQQIIKSN